MLGAAGLPPGADRESAPGALLEDDAWSLELGDDWPGPDAPGDSLILQEVAEQTSYGEVFLDDLIRRQQRLSLGVAGLFLMPLFGLPVGNLFASLLTDLRVFGLPLTWVLLTVLIYPYLWILAAYYLAAAGTLEDEFSQLVR